MGVDEQALFDLQTIWEQKLLASKVFKASDYPLGLGTANQHTGGVFFENQSQMASAFRQIPQNQSIPSHPGQYMPQIPGQMHQNLYNQQQPLRIDQMRPQQPPNPRPPHNGNNIPQFDGPDDDLDSNFESKSNDNLPQVDGNNSYENIALEENEQPKEDELNSDLDDPDSDIEQGGEIDDLLLCLYEKVHRARNKWKCNFKSGIFHIGEQDYAFNRLNGDFECDDEMSDFVCIASPKFTHRRTGLFTPIPGSLDLAFEEAKNKSQPKDNDDKSDEISLREALLMDPTFKPEEEKGKTESDNSLEGFPKYSNASTNRSSVLEVAFAVSYVIVVFAAGYFLAKYFDKSPGPKYSSKNVKLLTWKSYNETSTLTEDLFFDCFELVAERKLLPGPAKVRLLSANTKVSHELLPSGKSRVYLEVYEPKALSEKLQTDKKLAINETTGFYVLCEGEQMKCKCMRIVIMTKGKEPIYQRRCVCEPLDEGDATFEMTAPATSKNTGIVLPKFTGISEFVLAFNKYIHFSFSIFSKAGRIIKRVAFTLKRSSRLTFHRFKISVVDLYRRCDAGSFSSQLWKKAKDIPGSKSFTWKRMKDLTKAIPSQKTVQNYKKQLNKACKKYISSASSYASRMTTKVADQVEPKLKEYKSLLKAHLARE